MFKKFFQFIARTMPDFWVRYLGCFIIGTLCASGIVLMDFDRLSIRNETRIKWIAPFLSYGSFIENWLYDIRAQFLYHNEDVKAPNLAILQITESSLKTVGRWPWSRAQHAEIVDKLNKAGARAVLFDVLFPEPEKLCIDPSAPNPNTPPEAPDLKFANAIEQFQAKDRRAVIVGFSVTENSLDKMEEPPLEALLNDNMLTGGMGTYEKTYQGRSFINKYNFPIKELNDKKVHIGFLENEPDIDGVFRYYGIFAATDGFLLMSAGFALYHHYFKESPSDEIKLDGELSSISYPYSLKIKKAGGEEIHFPVNALGEVRVRYLGDEHAFQNYDIADLIKDDLNSPEILRKWRTRLGNKAIIIGSVATGAHDLRHTPVSATLPGMYVHANIFHMLDQQYFFKPVLASVKLSLYFLLAGIILVLFLSHLGAPSLEIASLFGAIALVAWVDHVYFLPEGYRPALFFICTGILGSYMWVTFLNVLKEIRERLKIRNAFMRYVSKDVVKQVLANPDKLRLGGEKRVISMMFSDIRSFTSISEQLTPQGLTTLLNTYMNKMTEILFAHQGTLDKYIGDALVAFWGAPMDLPDHPVKSVEAGVKMMEALPAINQFFKEKNLPVISVGIGINTGEVSVGNMGSDQIFAYTALGDHMNLASRLEGLTKYYHAGLLISEYTFQAMGEEAQKFRTRPLDRVQVKGREEPVTIYEVLPAHHPLYEKAELLADFHAAFALYLARDFAGALARLDRHESQLPDEHIQKLSDRCRDFLKAPPPPTWAGVTVFTEK